MSKEEYIKSWLDNLKNLKREIDLQCSEAENYEELDLWNEKRKNYEKAKDELIKSGALKGEILNLKYDYCYPVFYTRKFPINVEEIKRVRILFPDNVVSIFDTYTKQTMHQDGNCTHTIDHIFVRDYFRGRHIEYSLEDLLKEGIEIRLN